MYSLTLKTYDFFILLIIILFKYILLTLFHEDPSFYNDTMVAYAIK